LFHLPKNRPLKALKLQQSSERKNIKQHATSNNTTKNTHSIIRRRRFLVNILFDRDNTYCNLVLVEKRIYTQHNMDYFFVLPIGMVCKGIVFAAPLIAAGIFSATIAAPAPRSNSLIVISAIVAFTLGIAYYLHFRNAYLVKKSTDPYLELQKLLYKLFRPSSLYFALLHSSAIILFIILLIRLEATEHFGGSFQNLDFGTKVSGGVTGGANIAMTNSAMTGGHCVQGFFASFLSFPVVAGTLARLTTLKCSNAHSNVETKTAADPNASSILGSKPNIPLMITLELTTACMTIYPSYSVIKRFLKDGESFSKTSHANNVTEWVLGYFLGMGIGWCLTLLIQCHFYRLAGLNTSGVCTPSLCCSNGNDDTNDADRNDESKIPLVINLLTVAPGSEERIDGDTQQYGFGNAQEYECISSSQMVMVSKIISKFCTFMLILFSISSLLTGVFIGNTWNDDGIRTEGSASDEDMITLFVGIYVVITAVMVWFSAKMWPFNNVD
jgi:hypothetical protein